jgi:CPA1 family monovalent cation:H+ antiporter
MSSFDLAAIFISLVAAVGWMNAKVFKLPTGVAMLLAGLGGALIAEAIGGFAQARVALDLLRRINFAETVVGYMLAFLLFAGAMQVDLQELRRQLISIATLATLGVLVSTLLVGGGIYGLARALHLNLSLGWALVFGALISPTDPVAVLSTVRTGQLPASLLALLQGEALFNDGVGIVVFLAAIGLAVGAGAPNPGGVVAQVLAQGIGGLLLGLAGGALVVTAMRAIDDYAVEVALTLALASGVYALGQALHVSGPIAAVAAGLLVGDTAVMSEVTRRYVQGFWTLVDELLNALLFLLLGLETIVLPFDLRYVGLLAAVAPLVLAARLLTVLPWGAYLRLRGGGRGASLVLTWGGLRGALSVALALQIPHGPARGLILSLTYAVVVFSVVVQGLTFAPLVARLGRRTASLQGLSPQG